MSETYNANGTIPEVTVPFDYAVGPGIPIASSTNATPIVVTTSTPHGMSSGDTVVIEGHATNTAANGRWAVTVTGATTFRLNGSTGNGVGGATGYAVDYSVNPLITIPDDGDLAVASSVNPAFEGVFNTVPFLYERVGKFRLYNHWTFQTDGVAGNPQGNLDTGVTIPSAGTWVDYPGYTSLVQHSGRAPFANDGDFLSGRFDSTFYITAHTGAPTVCSVCAGLTLDLGSGPNIVLNSTKTLVVTDRTVLPTNGVLLVPASLVFQFSIGGAPPQGVPYNVGLQVFGVYSSSTAWTIQLNSSANFFLNHYRPNV